MHDLTLYKRFRYQCLWPLLDKIHSLWNQVQSVVLLRELKIFVALEAVFFIHIFTFFNADYFFANCNESSVCHYRYECLWWNDSSTVKKLNIELDFRLVLLDISTRLQSPKNERENSKNPSCMQKDGPVLPWKRVI